MRVFRGLESRIRLLRRKLSPLIYAGNNVFCPFCNRTYRRFRPAGRRKFKRLNAVCPTCGSRERDRLMYYFLNARTDLRIPNGKLLHIAPEACLSPAIKELAQGKYISCDLFRRDVDVQLNIEQLPFDDESFDIIFCSHVLPEVEHDDLAIQEIHRVLDRQGWALVSVPFQGQKTVEVRPGDGQEAPPEFFRIYGTDFPQVLAEQGFCVETVRLENVLDQEQQIRMRVNQQTASAIYVLRKS